MATKSQKLRDGIGRLVTAPVDIASLAAFRFLFGLMMAAGMVRFISKGWVRELYVEPVYHFTYPGFEWLRPWPEALMHAHFVVLALLAVGVALGYYYRICITLFFLGFTYVELLDQTAYLNHYYLISLISGLLIFLPANRAWSIDARRRPGIRVDAVPAWTVNLLRFQVGVVYIFAGLAKLNADWLFRAEPLRIWLPARSDLPLLGPWLEQLWVAYAASWFGAAFDTGIVFLLLCQRTRRAAYALVILFHLGTWVLFKIGMFPWIMIVAATLFFPADWPRYWLSRCAAMVAGRFKSLSARITAVATILRRPLDRRHAAAVAPSFPRSAELRAEALTLTLSLGERGQPLPGACFARAGLSNSVAAMTQRLRTPLPLPYRLSVLPASCRQIETMRGGLICRRDAGSTLDCQHEGPLSRYSLPEGEGLGEGKENVAHPIVSSGQPPIHRPASPAPPLLLVALGLYAALQLALPLRPYLTDQPSTWTCAGFNCAWQVMIAEKTGYAEFFARDPATGSRWKLSVKEYLTPRQEIMMAQDPYLIRALAHRLAEDLQANGGAPVQINVNAYATLNGHPSRRLIDPTTDLVGPETAGWILPFQQ